MRKHIPRQPCFLFSLVKCYRMQDGLVGVFFHRLHDVIKLVVQVFTLGELRKAEGGTGGL